MNDFKTNQQKSVDDLKLLINTNDTWIEYTPDKYLNCYKFNDNDSWTSENVPKFNNKYDILSYKYIIRNKYLKIRFMYSTRDFTSIEKGWVLYYIQLPIINSKQIIADKSCKFSYDGCTTLNCGINYSKSSVKSMGLIQLNSQPLNIMNYFLFDNQKIMFNVNINNIGSLNGVIRENNYPLSYISMMYFEIEIHISI